MSDNAPYAKHLKEDDVLNVNGNKIGADGKIEKYGERVDFRVIMTGFNMVTTCFGTCCEIRKERS